MLSAVGSSAFCRRGWPARRAAMAARRASRRRVSSRARGDAVSCGRTGSFGVLSRCRCSSRRAKEIAGRTSEVLSCVWLELMRISSSSSESNSAFLRQTEIEETAWLCHKAGGFLMRLVISGPGMLMKHQNLSARGRECEGCGQGPGGLTRAGPTSGGPVRSIGRTTFFPVPVLRTSTTGKNSYVLPTSHPYRTDSGTPVTPIPIGTGGGA